MRAVTDPEVETLVLCFASQTGKALAPETPIPTPSGWREIGDLRPGDLVLDEHGCPVTVRATARWEKRPTYRVEFTDGTSIVADEQHEWIVSHASKRFTTKPSKHHQTKTGQFIGEVTQFETRRCTTQQLTRFRAGKISIRHHVSAAELSDRYGLTTVRDPSNPDRAGIVAVTRLIGLRETVCIEVDSESHLFLAGEGCVPTCNSELVNNVLGYFAHFDPGPVMLVQPTIEMSESFSKDRVQPMLRDSPELARIFGDWRSRDQAQTIRHIKFPGGSFSFSGANSAPSLASRPIRIALMDEVDRYPLSVGEEGSPLGLVRTRTRNFWNRKIILTSTPTVEGQSLIWSELERSDYRVYECPCAHCGSFQRLEWSRVRWTPGQPETAEYVCSHCEEPWTEAERRESIHRGQWSPTKQSKTRGYHLNAIASLFNPLSYLANEFELIGNDRLRLIGFTNTALALPAKDEQIELSDPLRLRERAENFSLKQLPDAVVMISAGIDVQLDRIELTHLGWGPNDEVWVLDHRVMTGDPTKGAVWDEVRQILHEKHRHACGELLSIEAVAIDSGYATQNVYEFATEGQQRGKRWYAIKGRGGDLPLWKRGAKRLTQNSPVPFFIVGSDTGKTLLARMLATAEPGPSYVHFSTNLGPDYFEQLTAEQYVTRFVKNEIKRKWERKQGQDAEALDCFVYAMAARKSLTIDLADRARRFSERQPGSTQQKPKKTAADIARRLR
jgi:phage terminase large subunit GpA-like protein